MHKAEPYATKKAPRQRGRGAMKVYYNLSRRMTDQHDAIIKCGRKAMRELDLKCGEVPPPSYWRSSSITCSKTSLEGLVLDSCRVPMGASTRFNCSRKVGFEGFTYRTPVRTSPLASDRK